MQRSKWVYSIIRAINECGGEAHVSDIEKCELILLEQNSQERLDSTIHGMIHNYSFDHASGKKGGVKRGDVRDVFLKIRPATWKIRSYDNPIVKFALRQSSIEEAKTALANTGESKAIIEQIAKELEEEERVFVQEHWRSFPQKGVWKNQSFTISHADNSPFVGDGLRAFFEYRDLGIKTATDNQFGANVIRAVPGAKSPGTWHTHDLGFQMVYVTKGWVVFEYEGAKEQGGGEHMLRAGSCVLQPPGIKHREVRHSDDMELIEITSPAEFATRDAE